MDNILLFLNQSKVLWGVSMIMLQFGSRYILGDLGKSHEYILSHEITKKIIILAIFFVATRDIAISFILTIAYVIIIDGILHEKRKFSLIPKQMINEMQSNPISTEDYNKAKKIIEMYDEQKHQSTNTSELKNKLSYAKYMMNIDLSKLL